MCAVPLTRLRKIAGGRSIMPVLDPLPSWNDGPAKQSIIAFVEKVTKPGSPDFVPVPERIATFDNDGTLWCEQPVPVQFYFAVDRVKALAPQHPEWKNKEPFVGSSIKTKFEMRDGKPVLVRLPEINFIDDKAGKPVGINQHIGRRPVMAFGNSDGDKEMLEYTEGGSGARFMLLVLHDDAAREYAYGPAKGLPDVKLGAFTPALYEKTKKNGWTVISMKDDWKK